MVMNKIDTILQRYPNINRESLLILVSTLLDYWDNKCPESLASLRNDIDKWCKVTIPFPNYWLIKNREVVESDDFFMLLQKVENYRYYTDSLIIEGIRFINGGEVLQEWSQKISVASDGPCVDY